MASTNVWFLFLPYPLTNNDVDHFSVMIQ